MSELIVDKYGGSSSTHERDVKRKKQITEKDPARKILVLSAHGASKPDYTDDKILQEHGDTDLLIEIAKTRDMSIAGKIIERARGIYPGINDKEFKRLHGMLKRRVNTKKNLPEGAYSDAIKAFGDYMCAYLHSQALGYEFVDSKDVILLSSDFGHGRILPESEIRTRKRLLGKNTPCVIPSFYGSTIDNLIATSDRGGGDTWGAYIALELGADLYENFTDKNGVRAADPKIVPNAVRIKELTYLEQRQLSYSGFDIFHPDALLYVQQGGFPVHIKKTYGLSMDSWSDEGTYVVKDRICDPEKPIMGVAYKDGFCTFSIERFGLSDEEYIEMEISKILKEEEVPHKYIHEPIDAVSLIMKEEHLQGPDKIGRILKQMYELLGKNGTSIEFEDNLGCLIVAGKGLQGRKGIAAEIQTIMAKEDINLKIISQGIRERCILYGIKSFAGEKAVRAIYSMFIE